MGFYGILQDFMGFNGIFNGIYWDWPSKMWLHGTLNGDDKRLYHQHLYPPVMKYGLLDNLQLIDHGDDFPIETSI